ncbi:MAG: molybdate transport system substrate-binding protein [Bradyrhizobium sp.]|nr:molybdate transport system substrate-binding protein [Bradyrhizobium sp.]
MKWLWLPVLSAVLIAPALGAEVKVLSGGAVEPGLEAAVEAYRKESGQDVKIQYATAPMIRQKITAGEAADVVIAPPAIADELAKAGKLDASSSVSLGRVGIGVAVRNGVPKPDIANSEAVTRAVLDSEAVVFNRASSGIYLERMFERLGIAEQVKAKETRYPDTNAVMAHMVKGTKKEITLAPITELLLYKDKGLDFIGPLPNDIQNYTGYVAVVTAAPANREGAAALLKYFGTAGSKKLFAERGVE